MNYFLKNSGIFLMLAGSLILIIPFFTHLQSNLSLIIGWLSIIVGFIAYIVINKKMR
jgi:hypothetical protein